MRRKFYNSNSFPEGPEGPSYAGNLLRYYMAIPSIVEVLHFIARGEPLEKTLARYPEISREQLGALLREAAILFLAEEKKVPTVAPSPTPTPEPHGSIRPTLPNEADRVRGHHVSAETDSSGEQHANLNRRLRVYSDGASRGNPGPAGAGAVLTRDNGTVVAKLGKFLGNQTNNFAEYMGFVIGLENALQLGATEVDGIADSELMVRQLSGIYRVKSENIRPLFEKARKLMGQFKKATVRHVPREQNQLADEMSNRAIDEHM